MEKVCCDGGGKGGVCALSMKKPQTTDPESGSRIKDSASQQGSSTQRRPEEKQRAG